MRALKKIVVCKMFFFLFGIPYISRGRLLVFGGYGVLF